MPKKLEEDLAKLRATSKLDAVKVFPEITPKTNLRTTLEKIIVKADVKQWPKLWQNLRASASTDFARILPGHVAAAICGHTKQVAQEHYWTVGDSDLAGALSLLNNMNAQVHVETALEPEVKPEAVSVGNSSQGVTSGDAKTKKSQGKRTFPRDSHKDKWAMLAANRQRASVQDDALTIRQSLNSQASGFSTTTLSGGSVSVSEAGRP